MVFVNDRISDMVARLKNGYNAKLLSVKVLNSKIVIKVLLILQRLGYIRSFKILSSFEIEVFLSYYRNQPGIRYISRVSKLSRRVYINTKSLEKRVNNAMNSNGFYILSTNKGVLVDIEAKFLGAGGEVLLVVF